MHTCTCVHAHVLTHISKGKESLSTSGAGVPRIWKINELCYLLPHNLYKINIKGIIELTLKKLNIKFHEENSNLE